MHLPDGLRKHGFRKWYERELIQSHAHLVLTFICMIGVFAAFEVFSRNASVNDRLTNIATVLLCAAVGVWALRRYLYLLTHAEATAHQAVCPKCEAYGRFKLVSEDAREARVTVRCRGCEHQWPIDH